MKPAEELAAKLSDIHGIGVQMQQKLLDAFTDEAAVIAAIRARDINAFTRHGFKKSFAVRIIRSALSQGYRMLLSPDGRALYKKIVDLLREYPQINDVKDRMSTLVPNYWGTATEAHLDQVLAYKDIVLQVSAADMEKLLKVLAGAEYRPLPAADLPAHVTAITTDPAVAERWAGKISVEVADSVEILQEKVRETPFLRIIADDVEVDLDGSVTLPSSAGTADIFPELVARKAAAVGGYVQAYLAAAAVAPANFPLADQIAAAGESLKALEDDVVAVGERRDALTNALDAVEAAIRKLGEDEVSYDDVAKYCKKYAGTDEFLMDFDTIPATRAHEILEFSIARFAEEKIYAACRKSVKQLTPLVSNAKQIAGAVQDFDYWLAMGRFAAEFDLIKPTVIPEGTRLYFEGGRHLFLQRQFAQKTLTRLDPVMYVVGDAPESIPGVEGERITLLTGANSGGKTCLLETIFFIVLLPHMGLPVPATVAYVPAVRGIFFHRRHFAKSAGALESTLKRLMPAFSKATHILILVDEFEAITEPGAAARILSGLINILADQPALAVFVTHLSNEIAKVVGPVARLDAIQAAGLDRKLELITDHQPVFGEIGRSTPDLIVQKLLKTTKSKVVAKNYQSLQNTLAAGQATWQTRIDWFMRRREHKTGR